MAAQNNNIHKSSIVESSAPTRNHHATNDATVTEIVDEQHQIIHQDQHLSSSSASYTITFSTLTGPRRTPTGTARATVRDTRASVERHPFALLMEDDNLRAELQFLNGAGR